MTDPEHIIVDALNLLKELKARAEDAEKDRDHWYAKWVQASAMQARAEDAEAKAQGFFRDADFNGRACDEQRKRANAAELLAHQWEHDAKFWKSHAAKIVAAYDRENPVRKADAHSPDCTCLRCAIDNVRSTLEIKP